MVICMISHRDLSDDLRVTTLSGRLDILGTEGTAQEFTALATIAGRCVIVDLSELISLASICIRALISNGTAFQKPGGRIALAADNITIVTKMVETTVSACC